MHDEVAKRPCPAHAPFVFDYHERRARWVVVVTATMMVLELVVGVWTQSLALTADGWHMATHTIEVERCPHHEAA